MTFQESIPIAKELAENQLKKGFDVEAFLILSELNKFDICNEDIIPESNVDDFIQNMLKLFVTYYNNKSVETLKPLISTMRQVFSEIYNTCNTNEEKTEFRNFIKSCQNII